MIEFLMTFFVFLSVLIIMAIGVIRGRPPIAGSCGGLNAMGADGACEICGGNPSKCEKTDADLANGDGPKVKNALEA